MTTPKYPVMELSSPYGDCTFFVPARLLWKQLSPPYGDRTAYMDFYFFFVPFSPPYGDRTKCPLSPKSPLSFRPLTGIVLILAVCATFGFGFSPPYGDRTESHQSKS